MDESPNWQTLKPSWRLQTAALSATLSAVSRFGTALVIALGLHGLLAVYWFAYPPQSPNSRTRFEAAELQIAVEQPLSESTRRADERVDAVATEPLERVASIAPSTSKPRSTETAVVGSAAPVGDGAEPSATVGDGGLSARSAIVPPPAGVASPRAKIDFGLDGRLFRPSYRDVESTAQKKRDTGKELARKLNDSLVEGDVQRGLARGGVLVGSLNAAVRAEGPATGEAVIRVTVNSRGELSGLELLRGTSGDWDAALAAFREQAKRKVVRVPSGAQGLRVTFNVSAKIQLPSGNTKDSAAVALNRPSLAPDGLVPGGAFDVTDLSKKTSRVVYARVLSEEVL